jgi:sec-independent protein translocase protein TatA
MTDYNFILHIYFQGVIMGIGIWELVMILLIVVVLFGTKKLRDVGGDLGSAIRSFRRAMHEGEQEGLPSTTDAKKPNDPKAS